MPPARARALAGNLVVLLLCASAPRAAGVQVAGGPTVPSRSTHQEKTENANRDANAVWMNSLRTQEKKDVKQNDGKRRSKHSTDGGARETSGGASENVACARNGVNVAAEWASFEAELDELYGLSDVKKAAKQVFTVYAFDELYKEQGPQNGKLSKASQRYAFLGPPGTGKTTVAKLFSTMFCRLGRVNYDRIHQTRPDELIDNKVGGTQDVVKKNLEKGKGGVIFIDEAYLLAGDPEKGPNSFQLEAIGVLMKLMDTWTRTVFIFAGYEKQMQHMFKANSGFKRRVAQMFHFKSYTTGDLASMFVAKARKQNANMGVGFFPDDITTRSGLPALLQGFSAVEETPEWNEWAGNESDKIGARFLRFLEVGEDASRSDHKQNAWEVALQLKQDTLRDRVLQLLERMPEPMREDQNAALIDKLFERAYEFRARRIMDEELMSSDGCLPKMEQFSKYRKKFARACPVVFFYTYGDLEKAAQAEVESWGPTNGSQEERAAHNPDDGAVAAPQ